MCACSHALSSAHTLQRCRRCKAQRTASSMPSSCVVLTMRGAKAGVHEVTLFCFLREITLARIGGAAGLAPLSLISLLSLVTAMLCPTRTVEKAPGTLRLKRHQILMSIEMDAQRSAPGRRSDSLSWPIRFFVTADQILCHCRRHGMTSQPARKPRFQKQLLTHRVSRASSAHGAGYYAQMRNSPTEVGFKNRGQVLSTPG